MVEIKCDKGETTIAIRGSLSEVAAELGVISVRCGAELRKIANELYGESGGADGEMGQDLKETSMLVFKAALDGENTDKILLDRLANRLLRSLEAMFEGEECKHAD